jgi:peptide/nickel transport system substrate-binding protein
VPKAQYWQRFNERGADIMMIGWQSDTQDSSNLYEFLAMTPDAKTGYGQYNAGNCSNPKVDRLTLQTQSMTDPKVRAEVLRKIEHILYDDAALVPLHWQHLSWAAAKTVHIATVLNIIEFPYLGDLVME